MTLEEKNYFMIVIPIVKIGYKDNTKKTQIKIKRKTKIYNMIPINISMKMIQLFKKFSKKTMKIKKKMKNDFISFNYYDIYFYN